MSPIAPVLTVLKPLTVQPLRMRWTQPARYIVGCINVWLAEMELSMIGYFQEKIGHRLMVARRDTPFSRVWHEDEKTGNQEGL